MKRYKVNMYVCVTKLVYIVLSELNVMIVRFRPNDTNCLQIGFNVLSGFGLFCVSVSFVTF